jgi:hypothetical protein
MRWGPGPVSRGLCHRCRPHGAGGKPGGVCGNPTTGVVGGRRRCRARGCSRPCNVFRGFLLIPETLAQLGGYVSRQTHDSKRKGSRGNSETSPNRQADGRTHHVGWTPSQLGHRSSRVARIRHAFPIPGLTWRYDHAAADGGNVVELTMRVADRRSACGGLQVGSSFSEYVSTGDGNSVALRGEVVTVNTVDDWFIAEARGFYTYTQEGELAAVTGSVAGSTYRPTCLIPATWRFTRAAVARMAFWRADPLVSGRTPAAGRTRQRQVRHHAPTGGRRGTLRAGRNRRSRPTR